MGSTVFIAKEKASSLRLVNSTGVALVVDEFTVMRGHGLVAAEAIASLAEGALANADGCEMQVADFVTAEGTFGAADLPVYWDPVTKKFSHLSTVGYWIIGYSKGAKSGAGVLEVICHEPIYVSDGISTLGTALSNHIGDTADAHDASAISILDSAERFTATEVEAALAELAGSGRTTETVKANAAAIAAVKAHAGTPFRKTGTLTSAAAATAVHLLTAAEVAAIGAGAKAYILGAILKVDGGTGWSDSTGSVVTIQDDNGTPVVALTYAKAQLTGNAVLVLASTGVTIGDPVAEGTGLTAAKGIDIIADSNFDAGDSIKVTVFGYIA